MRNITLIIKDRHRIEAPHYDKGGHAETIFDQQPDLFMKHCLDWFGGTL